MSDENKETTSSKDDKIEEQKVEEPLDEKDVEAESLGDSKEEDDKEELAKAKQLYKALQDPATAKQVVQVLASQLGLLDTKQEVKTAKKTIHDVFKESLGEEYAFLADKLSPAINNVIDLRMQEVREALQARDARDTEREVEEALSYLRKFTKGESKKHEDRMAELMDEILPSPKIPTREYLRRLYTIASEEDKTRQTKKEMADKINRNASDVSSRLRSSGVDDSRTKGISKPSLRQAIELAAAELERK